MIMHDIPLPRLLDSTMNTARWITPVNVFIALRITPLSYASISLPPGEKLPARGYMELYTCMGSAGVFRLRSPQESYGDDGATAELEHAVVEVGDYLVREKYDEMMPAIQAMQTVFSYYGGSLWQLGNINALGSGNVALSTEYDKVLTVMLDILSQRPECMMTFDYSTSPWSINIVSRGTEVTAEGRLSRNINNAKISYDDTDLCTRVYYEKASTTDTVTEGYPVFDQNTNYAAGTYVIYQNKLYDLTDGHKPGVTWANTTKEAITDIPTTEWFYVEDSTARNTYGLIERTVSTGTGYTDAEAEYTANQYLEAHKKPRISVQISAEELSCITGESFDAFGIGKLCRLALIDYNTVIEQNVTELTFNSVYNRPMDITVNLADEEDMVINFLHDVDVKGGTDSGGGGGGGGGKKKTEDKFKEYYTKIEQDDYHIRLTSVHADEVRGILQAAGIDIDSQTGVVLYHDDIENSVGSRLSVNARKIAMVVGTDEEQGQERDYIKAGEIALSINETTGESIALINANHVNISSTNTAHLLSGSIVYDDVTGNLILKESSGGGVYVEHNDQGTTAQFGVWDRGSLTGGVMVQEINGQDQQTVTRLIGDVIIIGNDSSIDARYQGQTLDGSLAAITTDFTSVNTLLARKIEAEDINATTVQAAISQANLLSVHQLAASSSIGTTGAVSCAELYVGGNQASWKSMSVVTDISVSNYTGWNFATCDSTGAVVGNYYMAPVKSVTETTETIYYLGRTP